MASTATTRNRFEKQGPGENLNSWGAKLNSALELVDAAMDGVSSYTLNGAKTLTSVNFSTDEARMRVQNITGGTGGTVTIPSVEKLYVVRNVASGSAVFTTGTGNTAAVASGLVVLLFCDGVNCYVQNFAEYVNAAVAAMEGAEAAEAAALAERLLAQAARIGAETARTGAETARTGSQAAQAASELARDQSQAAQALAEAAAQAAINPKWGAIDTNNLSGNQVDIVNISQFFSDISLEITGLDLNTTGDLALALSTDGTSFTPLTTVFSETVSTSNIYRASFLFVNYAADLGPMTGGVFNGATTNGIATNLGTSPTVWRCPGGIKAIRIRWIGATFAGTARLLAR